MWWPVILIIFVVSLALGPLMLMQPSPRQRQLAKLRALASKRGLVVRMTKHPDEAAKSGSIAAYSLPWSKGQYIAAEWRLVKRHYEHDIHFCHNWDWQGKGRADSDWQEALKAALPHLPESIVALECTTLGLGGFWLETCRDISAEQAVDEIYGLLTEISESAPGDCFEVRA